MPRKQPPRGKPAVEPPRVAASPSVASPPPSAPAVEPAPAAPTEAERCEVAPAEADDGGDESDETSPPPKKKRKQSKTQEDDDKNSTIICIYKENGEPYCAAKHHRGSHKSHIINKHPAKKPEFYNPEDHAKLYVYKHDWLKRKQLGLTEATYYEEKIQRKLEEIELKIDANNNLLQRVLLQVKQIRK